MMVQSYMQDEGKTRGIRADAARLSFILHIWADGRQKEHAKPPQVWSSACALVIVGIV